MRYPKPVIYAVAVAVLATTSHVSAATSGEAERGTISASSFAGDSTDLAALLVPDALSAESLPAWSEESGLKSADRRVSIDLNGTTEFVTTWSVTGNVPVFDANGLFQGGFEFAAWTGRGEDGEYAFATFGRDKTGRWSTVAADIELEASRFGFSVANQRFDPIALSDDDAVIDSAPGLMPDLDPAAGLVQPVEVEEEAIDPNPASGRDGLVSERGFRAAPGYPIPVPPAGGRQADLLAVGVQGPTSSQAISPPEAIAEALRGVSEFNTAIQNSYLPYNGGAATWPINDVSLRLVGVANVDYNQTANMGTDYSAVHLLANPIRSGIGADLTVVVFPNNWTNGSATDSCGGGGYEHSQSVIGATLTSDSDCTAVGRRAIAHEVLHNYGGGHDTCGGPTDPCHESWARGRQVSSSVRTLSTSSGNFGSGGRDLQISNPEVRMIDNTGYWSGESTRNNARAVDDHALVHANRGSVATTNNVRYEPLVVPVRVMDTRTGHGGYSTRFSSGENRQISTLVDGVPSNAYAVAATVTIVSPTQAGYLQARNINSFTSSMPTITNFMPGEVHASSTIIKLGDYGSMWLRAVGNPHVVIDVYGYFGGNGANHGYHPLATPVRRCDTRGTPNDTTGTCGSTAVGSGGGHTVTITSQCAAGTTGALVNLTAIGNSSGYLQAMQFNNNNWKDDWTSANFLTGEVRGNLVFVPVSSSSTSRTFYIHVGGTGANAHFIADVYGCFGPGGMRYSAFNSPERRLDTRNNTGGAPNIFSNNETQQVTMYSSTYAGRVAFVNLTAINVSAPSWMAAYPTGTTTNTSSLNMGPGGVFGNHAAVTVDSLQQFTLQRGGASGTNHMIVDQFGFFYP